MNRPTLVTRSALLACGLLLAACGTTPPARFYSLEPLPAAAGAATDAGGLPVNVGPVIMSQGLDRPQMLTRLGPNELALHDYERWAEPLAENIARVLTEDLSVVLGSQRVGNVPDSPTPEPSLRVTLQLLTFEAGADGNATLVARWRIYKPAEALPFATRRSEFVTPLATRDGAGIAAAMSANLASLAHDIAAALPGR